MNLSGTQIRACYMDHKLESKQTFRMLRNLGTPVQRKDNNLDGVQMTCRRGCQD